MLLSKSSCVCIPCHSKGLSGQNIIFGHFWTFFGGFDMKKKTTPRFKCFSSIPFLAFLALKVERKRCGQMGSR